MTDDLASRLVLGAMMVPDLDQRREHVRENVRLPEREPEAIVYHAWAVRDAAHEIAMAIHELAAAIRQSSGGTKGGES